jgi:ubiquinol-cytochrome c reductase cytochrome b subunit
MRIIREISLLGIVYDSLINYPSPSNLSYFWNFGIYSLACLGIQIVTGIFLAMHYAAEVNVAFASVEHIMRDVSYGWLLRYIHANGASMFFIVVYMHTFRGLYYTSYMHPRQALWGVGVIILLLMILTAFMGYVLPWGQMSFWGATVITNLASAVPFIGNDIVVWLWGGYSVDNATLNRFFSLHYLFPFILVGLVGVHLLYLHESLSTNPLGIFCIIDKIPLYPYYFLKDLLGVLFFFMFFSLFLFFMPNLLGHPDNYIPANPMVTPAHIVPEWYFLPFYAILRSIPDKLAGVCALLFAIVALLLLPYIVKPEIRSTTFRPISKYLFWFIVLDAVILGWLGSKTVKFPYVQAGQLATVFYFAYFLVILPLVVRLEAFFWSNEVYLAQMEKKVRSNIK